MKVIENISGCQTSCIVKELMALSELKAAAQYDLRERLKTVEHRYINSVYIQYCIHYSASAQYLQYSAFYTLTRSLGALRG